jgi:nucleotide-binding universal stress UspA family protein
MSAELPQQPGVVVGVDGSDSSHAALAYAAWEAQRRGRPLTIVHCYDLAPSFGLTIASDGAATDAAQAAAQGLADLAEQTRAVYPELRVNTALVAGRPGATLVQASKEAELLVVGSRGLGGFAGLLLGSVGAQLSAHSGCPVIVMRPPDERGELSAGPPPRPVVVGVDGIPQSQAAITFAFEEAANRGVPVVVTYAWWTLPVSGLLPVDTLDGDDVSPSRTAWLRELAADPDLRAAEQEARRLLAEATAGTRSRFPDVEVELRPTHALNPAVALLDASADAGLVVVSRHGGNALTRLFFSSVGDVVAREAACPVAVVPEPSTADGGEGGDGRGGRRGMATAGTRSVH